MRGAIESVVSLQIEVLSFSDGCFCNLEIQLSFNGIENETEKGPNRPSQAEVEAYYMINDKLSVIGCLLIYKSSKAVRKETGNLSILVLVRLFFSKSVLRVLCSV